MIVIAQVIWQFNKCKIFYYLRPNLDAYLFDLTWLMICDLTDKYRCISAKQHIAWFKWYDSFVLFVQVKEIVKP